MTFSTLAELTAYWLAMPTVVPSVKGVTVGDDTALLNQQSSSVLYPHLRVDTPSITFIDPDNDFRTRYSYVLAVLMNAPISDNAKENQALSDTLEVLKAVYRQLLTDSNAEKFDLVLENASGFDVQRFSGDNDFGWTLKVNVELPNKTC